MSKAVLISIRPKWCELIASGKKTIEIRKTRPKIETPFKCYMYMSKYHWAFDLLRKYGMEDLADRLMHETGTVIGEFVCAEIDRYARYGWLKEPARYMKLSHGGYPATEIHYASLQLSPTALEDYGKGALLSGWHISNLRIYEKPKALSDYHSCSFCDYRGVCPDGSWCQPLKRPPQSWCYVETLEDQ